VAIALQGAMWDEKRKRPNVFLSGPGHLSYHRRRRKRAPRYFRNRASLNVCNASFLRWSIMTPCRRCLTILQWDAARNARSTNCHHGDLERVERSSGLLTQRNFLPSIPRRERIRSINPFYRLAGLQSKKNTVLLPPYVLEIANYIAGSRRSIFSYARDNAFSRPAR